jgi:hypothetical protein
MAQWLAPGTRRWLLAGLVCAVLECACTSHRAPERATVSARDLAEDLVLGPEWLELAPDPPLFADSASSELVLHHSTRLTFTRGPEPAQNAIYEPGTGESLGLEIEFVDGAGQGHWLGAGGLSPGCLGMKLPEDAPARFEVAKLRLRSKRPLALSTLEWRARTGEGAAVAIIPRKE